jgi:hypothetical protein
LVFLSFFFIFIYFEKTKRPLVKKREIFQKWLKKINF